MYRLKFPKKVVSLQIKVINGCETVLKSVIETSLKQNIVETRYFTLTAAISFESDQQPPTVMFSRHRYKRKFYGARVLCVT
jgi:type II secretory pathway component PulK